MHGGKTTAIGYLNPDAEVHMNGYTISLPNTTDKTNALSHFLAAVAFLDGREEFSKAELQRHLKCGYGTVSKVLDALYVLCVVDKVIGTSIIYCKN